MSSQPLKTPSDTGAPGAICVTDTKGTISKVSAAPVALLTPETMTVEFRSGKSDAGPESGDTEGEGDGAAPVLGLGLAEAASAPTAVVAPHHCGSATVAERLHVAASEPERIAGAGPHT